MHPYQFKAENFSFIFVLLLNPDMKIFSHLLFAVCLLYLYCLSLLLFDIFQKIISLKTMTSASHVHLKDTRVNLIMYGNFFLLIVIIYSCKLA